MGSANAAPGTLTPDFACVAQFSFSDVLSGQFANTLSRRVPARLHVKHLVQRLYRIPQHRATLVRMSGKGQEQTFVARPHTSAVGGNADIVGGPSECPVLATSGHSAHHTGSQAVAPGQADPAFAMDGLQPDQPFP